MQKISVLYKNIPKSFEPGGHSPLEEEDDVKIRAAEQQSGTEGSWTIYRDVMFG